MIARVFQKVKSWWNYVEIHSELREIYSTNFWTMSVKEDRMERWCQNKAEILYAEKKENPVIILYLNIIRSEIMQTISKSKKPCNTLCFNITHHQSL